MSGPEAVAVVLHGLRGGGEASLSTTSGGAGAAGGGGGGGGGGYHHYGDDGAVQEGLPEHLDEEVSQRTLLGIRVYTLQTRVVFFARFDADFVCSVGAC